MQYFGSRNCREPSQDGILKVLTLKEADKKDNLPEPQVVIIEVEILPIPEYKPDFEKEKAANNNLQRRITHYPSQKTLH